MVRHRDALLAVVNPALHLLHELNQRVVCDFDAFREHVQGYVETVVQVGEADARDQVLIALRVEACAHGINHHRVNRRERMFLQQRSQSIRSEELQAQRERKRNRVKHAT